MNIREILQTFWNETLPQWWSPTGYFEVTPAAQWPFREVYLGLIALLFLGGIVTLFLRFRPILKGKLLSFFWTNASIGVVLFFLRDQRIPYLGMDLLRLMHHIGMIVWVNSIIWYMRTGLRHEKLSEQIEARRAKYLPK
jgi:hypothetical protein